MIIHISLLKTFEGWKDANYNGRKRQFYWDKFLSSVTLQMKEDMRMQFVDLFSIDFIDKLKGANVNFLRFSKFKAFNLLKVGIIYWKK